MGRVCAQSSVPLLLSLNCVCDRLFHGLLPVQVPPRSLTTAEQPQAGGPQPGKAAPDGHGYHGVHQRGEPAAENHPRFARYGLAAGHTGLGVERAVTVLLLLPAEISPVICVYTESNQSPRDTSY